MQNIEYKLFISTNGLKQKDVADYLGVTNQFISQVIQGKCNLPSSKLKALLNNDKGWDVSMLTGPTTQQSLKGDNNLQIAGNNNQSHVNSSEALLRAIDEIGEQRRLVAKSQEQIDRLLGIIERLDK